jgi:hypothetical protein
MAIKNVYEIVIFRLPTACKLLSFLNTGRDSGGEGGGVAERQQGRQAAFASTNMCGGLLVLSLYFKFFYLTH